MKADGFHNIVLLSPYDIGQSAIEPNAAAAALATQYSISIRNAESHLYTPGVNTYFVDVLSLLQRVQAHPAAYGFLHINAVDNCQANNCNSLLLALQNIYIFNDILHLTNGFDQVLTNDAAWIINAGITVSPCGEETKTNRRAGQKESRCQARRLVLFQARRRTDVPSARV